MRLALKVVAFAAIFVVGLLLAHHLGISGEGFERRLQATLASLGPWAPIAFIGFKVMTVVFAIPSAPVTVAGGLLFGVVWGTLINVFAATLGACFTFFIGRKLGRDEVEKRLGGRLKELDDGLAHNGLSFMLFLRLVPLFPFNGINYGAGLTRLSFRDYLLGTFFGIMPGAAVFTVLGAAAAERNAPMALAGLAALGLLALIPVFVRKKPGQPAQVAQAQPAAAAPQAAPPSEPVDG